MSRLEIGQVLSLRIRFNNSGVISQTKHPYLIVGIDEDLGVVEIAQLDSLKGKEYKAAFLCNKAILNQDPIETVIDRDSFIQMDNLFRIENCPELVAYRRQEDKLSGAKLQEVIAAYEAYHRNHVIDENKNVYMDRAEILDLN